MNFDVFSSSVVGYKNLIKSKTSQDYCEYKQIQNGIICSLADGHSSDFFEYSDIGAKLACKSGIYVLENYIKEVNGDINKIKSDLKEGKIQKDIYYKWIELVDKHYKQDIPVVFRTQYHKYATTLVLVLIYDNFRLYFSIGDSYIILKQNQNYTKVLGINNGYLVKSLSSEEAYKDIEYYLEEINDKNKDDYIILFSDGFSNGFNNYKNMISDLDETISKYNKSVFSKLLYSKSYKKHLESISKNKSYDDITIMFIKSL